MCGSDASLAPIRLSSCDVMSGCLIGATLIDALLAICYYYCKYPIDTVTQPCVVVLPALRMIALLEALAVHYGDGASLLASRALFFPEWWSSMKPDSIRTFVWNGFFAVSLIFHGQKCSSDTFLIFQFPGCLWSLVVFITSFIDFLYPEF